MILATIPACFFTLEMLHAKDMLLKVKVTDTIQKSGLDYHMHGEVARAYSFDLFEYKKFKTSRG